MSRKMIKAVASIVTATALLLSTATCFAATADTFVKYADGVITVQSTMSDITAGSDVTYLATVSDGAPSTKADILYINQINNSAGGPHSVTYTITGDKADLVGKIKGYIKYGSDNSTVASELNSTDPATEIKVSQITVTYNEAHIAAIEEVYVGNGANTTITVEVNDGYEITGATINGVAASEDVIATKMFTVPYADEPSLVIETQATVATMSFTEVPATFTAEKNSDGASLYTTGLVVRALNIESDVTGYGIYVADASGNPLSLGDADTLGGYYPAAQVNDEGYYAVNVVSDTIDLSTYTVKPYYVKNGVNTVVD